MSSFLTDCFARYEKMPESTRKWSLTEKDIRVMQKARWCVTEKIHGAHFVFLTNGQDVLCAKRKEVLESDDPFFGYAAVLERHEQKVLGLFHQIHKQDPSLRAVLVYGELYGGEYPHPDVAPSQGVQAVQTGVYYAPEIQFCAFDLGVVSESGERSYVAYEVALEQLEEANIPVAAPLFVGSYEDALAYEPIFPSLVPSLLGLPTLPQPNWAEGVVIKPMEALLVNGKKGLVRPIVKHKHPQFMEDARFHQAKRWTPSFTSEPTTTLLDEAIARCTQTRWDNAVSKIGRPKKLKSNMWRKVEALFVEDVLSELEEDFSTLWMKATSEDIAIISEEVEATFQKLMLSSK